jgi:hypothetical protein
LDKEQQRRKQMAKSRSGAGGGIKSKQHVSVGVRTGKAAQGRRHEAVSQIGQAMGNHSTDSGGKIHKGAIERVEGAPRPISVKMGNEVAKSTVCGPGGSRTVMRAGSQGMQGAPNPGNAPAKNTDILRQFGPDVPGRR